MSANRRIWPHGLIWLILSFQVAWCLPCWAQKATVTPEERRMDVAFLDSVLGPRMTACAAGESGLSARNGLVQHMAQSGGLEPLSWALAIQRWLASAGDAHLRVGFESMTDQRVSTPPPSCSRLLAAGGWGDFGPGPGVSHSGQCAWLQKTWPWLGVLRLGMAEPGPEVALESGMQVLDHGAFMRWRIASFGEGTARGFARDFRRCMRRLRRAKKPVMLDLRGNLGGFRTRRHAVLGGFLDSEFWPLELEGNWDMHGEVERVPPMPVVRVRRPLRRPLAVMLDGGSFSASLLLADALLLAGRAKVFGAEPLGMRGGCSGSPQPHVLPGSRLTVHVPTLQTELGQALPVPFGLPDVAGGEGQAAGWNAAVHWLLSSDLLPLR